MGLGIPEHGLRETVRPIRCRIHGGAYVLFLTLAADGIDPVDVADDGVGGRSSLVFGRSDGQSKRLATTASSYIHLPAIVPEWQQSKTIY